MCAVERRDPVVVAVAVLVVGDRVVLVDDRHAAELEQPHERLAGVQVLLAVDEVVRVEQHLRGDDAVAAELGVPHLHQPALAGRRQRLQRGHVGRPGRQPECRDAGGHRSRRDHEHLVARLAHGDDLVAQLGDRAAVDRAVLVRQRRRADLGDDAHQRSGWYSKLNSPIHTTSPSRAPARASILGTPSRSSRWSMNDSASGVVTSFRATMRSTSRPTSRNSSSPDALDERARRFGPEHDDSVDDGLGLACLVHERRHAPDELAHALPGHGRDHRTVPARRTQLVDLHGVGLGADDDAWTLEQFGFVGAELAQQDPLLLGGRDAVDLDQVEHQTQHAGAFDVAQELVPESPALAGTLDQPGDVGDDEVGGVVDAHDTEVRLERRERIVGDLRACRRHDADQRALADVREADERDIGHQLHLELEPPVLAVLTLLGEARRATLVRQELGVAAPTAPTGGRQPAIAVVQQFGEQLAAVEVGHDGALGHRDLERLPALAVLVLALAVHPVVGAAVRMVAERQQRRHVVVGDEPDIAALAAVAAVRTALHDRTLASERHAARAAVTAAYVELAFVDELGHQSQRYRPPPTPFCLLQTVRGAHLKQTEREGRGRPRGVAHPLRRVEL